MGIYLETLVFKKMKTTDGSIFDFYPPDWQSELLSEWAKIKSTSNIYALYNEDLLLAMGIVFSGNWPQSGEIDIEASKEFRKFKYIGYVYTHADYRNQNIGSYWFKSLVNLHPDQQFWLSIEDLNLEKFYLKIGFQPWAKNDKFINEKVFYLKK